MSPSTARRLWLLRESRDLSAQSFNLEVLVGGLRTYVHRGECTCVLWTSTLYCLIYKNTIVHYHNKFKIRLISLEIRLYVYATEADSSIGTQEYCFL